jgi:hypothetical protein
METKTSYEDSLKSQDTEEWLDLVFYRRIGYLWALFFKKLNISPNAVTVFSIILGVAGGIMFYFPVLWINIIGMILVVWANLYDSADGQVARMTGNYSRLGRILDGAAGDLWFISIYASLCFRLMPSWGLWIWLLAAAAGYCHTKQAAVADYIRNFHLLIVKGKKGSELEDSVSLTKDAKQLTWKKDGIEKIFMFFYIPYTKGQEDLTPDVQSFRKTLIEKFSETEPPAGFRQEFRMASRPMMKYANILSFNTRTVALFISIITGLSWLYFVFELTVLNIIFIYLLLHYGTICKGFDLRLRGNN